MKDRKLFLIGNAHIDPVWLWRKPEGLAEIKASFRSALDRMDEFDGYIFTSACAGYYKWVEENEPALFDEIRARISEGRWAYTGGMWVQPDCNIPSGESFARHLLYSQRYFASRFGKPADTGYNVDSFGHNGMLPQLLAKAGIKNYVYMRPDDKKENPSLTANLFRWESPDGSSVLTYRLPFAYTVTNMPDIDAHLSRCEQDGHPYMVFYGVGNHGGGPSIKVLRELNPFLSDEICYASPSDYFDAVNAAGLAGSLPVVRYDLQHHASGCYSANSLVKKLNRTAENALCAAEKFGALCASLLPNTASRQAALTSAWESVLFNQFHDILAGCCIREAYDDASFELAGAISTAAEVQNFMLQRISWNINTNPSGPAQKSNWQLWESEGEGAPVVVFNPHGFPVRRAVQINNSDIGGVRDADGNPLITQKVRGSQTNGTDRYNHIFTAEIPAFGYRTYYLSKREQDTPAPDDAPSACTGACENILENRFLRVEFDSADGSIRTLTDKQTGRVINSAGFARALVLDDTMPDTWSHGVFIFDSVVGQFDGAELRVLDEGPLKATIRVTSRYNRSVLRQDFTLFADSREIEVNCRLFFGEELKIVKLSFPAATQNPEAVYSMPYGFITKPADGAEEPAQRWAAISGGSGGVAVLNDCKHSYSADGAELRMIIARGCIFADHYGERDDLVEYQDQGEQQFRYCILPFDSFSPQTAARIVRQAALLNQELIHISETHHSGPLDSSFSGAEISAENVLLDCVKPAEDGGGTVARLYETSGIETDADFTLFGRSIRLSFAPQEVKTVLFPDSGAPCETNLLEEPV